MCDAASIQLSLATLAIRSRVQSKGAAIVQCFDLAAGPSAAYAMIVLWCQQCIRDIALMPPGSLSPPHGTSDATIQAGDEA